MITDRRNHWSVAHFDPVPRRLLDGDWVIPEFKEERVYFEEAAEIPATVWDNWKPSKDLT